MAAAGAGVLAGGIAVAGTETHGPAAAGAGAHGDRVGIARDDQVRALGAQGHQTRGRIPANAGRERMERAVRSDVDDDERKVQVETGNVRGAKDGQNLAVERSRGSLGRRSGKGVEPVGVDGSDRPRAAARERVAETQPAMRQRPAPEEHAVVELVRGLLALVARPTGQRNERRAIGETREDRAVAVADLLAESGGGESESVAAAQLRDRGERLREPRAIEWRTACAKLFRPQPEHHEPALGSGGRRRGGRVVRIRLRTAWRHARA